MIPLVLLLNYTLALLMWLILGRAALGVLTGARPSPLQAFFDRFTLPVFALTRRLLPFVGEALAPLVAFLLLAVMRVALVVLTHPGSGR